MRCHQSQAQEAVDRSLKGLSRTPHLLLNKLGNIIVDRKCGSHIMMFLPEPS